MAALSGGECDGPIRPTTTAGVFTIDPRLLDAIVAFTGEVAEVAMTLRNLGLHDEAGRLVIALDTLDTAGED
jgi:hypothetical protein